MTPEQKRALAKAAARRRREQAQGSGQQVTPEDVQQIDPSAGGGELGFFGIDTGISTPQWLDRVLSGAGKFMVDTARGAEQFARDMSPGESAREQELDREIEQSRKRDEPLMDTGAGITGNILGGVATFAPTAFVPGANTYTGSALIGAGLGALQPVTEDQSRGINAAGGAAGGLAGRALAGGMSRVLAPKTRPDVMALRQEGVKPTPGQIMGGAAQRIEEGMTSVPVVGDFIKGGQRRALADFNRAALNRVLAPLGKTTHKVGREGIEEVTEQVNDAYRTILPKVTARLDDGFTADLKTVAESVDELAEPQRRRFQEIVANKVLNRFRDLDEIPGETVQKVDSELGRLASGYNKSMDVDQQDLGRVLFRLQESVRDLVGRTSKEGAEELSKARQAYKQLVRVRDASRRARTDDGLITPAALRAASKSTDASRSGRSFASGKADMQDLAEAGQSVLGAKVPDSGTPFRAANVVGVGGGYMIDPMLVMGAAGTGGMYTKPMQSMMARALTSRPESVRAVGQGIQRLNPYAAALSTPGLFSQ